MDEDNKTMIMLFKFVQVLCTTNHKHMENHMKKSIEKAPKSALQVE